MTDQHSSTVTESAPAKRRPTKAQRACLQVVDANQPIGHKDRRLTDFHHEDSKGYDVIGLCLRDDFLKWDARANLLTLTDAGRAALTQVRP